MTGDAARLLLLVGFGIGVLVLIVGVVKLLLDNGESDAD